MVSKPKALSEKGVVIYTADYCPYCHRAVEILESKGVEFKQIDVTQDPSMRKKLEKLTHSDTVPQIFVDGKSIGGCDDLEALYAQGGCLGYERG